MILSRIFAVAVICTALIAPAASAQTPAKTGYDETGVLPQLPKGEVLGNNDGGNADDVIPPPASTAPTGREDAPTPATPTVRRETGAPPVKVGELPFTGLDVGIVALLGVLLLGTGFAMRRSRGARAT